MKWLKNGFKKKDVRNETNKARVGCAEERSASSFGDPSIHDALRQLSASYGL